MLPPYLSTRLPTTRKHPRTRGVGGLAVSVVKTRLYAGWTAQIYNVAIPGARMVGAR